MTPAQWPGAAGRPWQEDEATIIERCMEWWTRRGDPGRPCRSWSNVCRQKNGSIVVFLRDDMTYVLAALSVGPLRIRLLDEVTEVAMELEWTYRKADREAQRSMGAGEDQE